MAAINFIEKSRNKIINYISIFFLKNRSMFSSKTKKVVFKIKPVAANKGECGEKYFVKIGKDKTHSYESENNGVIPFDTEAERFYRVGNLVKTRVFLPEREKVVLYKEGPKRRHPIKIGEAVISYMDFLDDARTCADFVLCNKDGKRTTLRISIKRTWKHEYSESNKNKNECYEDYEMEYEEED